MRASPCILPINSALRYSMAEDTVRQAGQPYLSGVRGTGTARIGNARADGLARMTVKPKEKNDAR